ncbi:MAG: bacteriohemerythrin [Acidobacteriota bacterium]
MKLTLTPELRVGIGVIDKQHEELFSRINLLFDSMSRGTGKAQVGGVMQFLEQYMRSHFATEEGYMASHSYPDLAPHQSQHRDFEARLSELRESLQADGIGEELAIRLDQLLCNYLVGHIARKDRAMAEFLRTRI